VLPGGGVTLRTAAFADCSLTPPHGMHYYQLTPIYQSNQQQPCGISHPPAAAVYADVMQTAGKCTQGFLCFREVLLLVGVDPVALRQMTHKIHLNQQQPCMAVTQRLELGRSTRQKHVLLHCC
jgi:hypothetical protein